VDNITIYIFKEANLRDTVRFKMAEYASDLPDKEIDVEGIDAI